MDAPRHKVCGVTPALPGRLQRLRPLLPSDAQEFVSESEAHGVLPSKLRNFSSFETDDRYAAAYADALGRQRVAVALSMMLRHQAQELLCAAKDLPVTLVKGLSFARAIYPAAF